jgi:hypothetical protein
VTRTCYIAGGSSERMDVVRPLICRARMLGGRGLARLDARSKLGPWSHADETRATGKRRA